MQNQKFKKKNLLLVIILYLGTSGLYGIYWAIKNGYLASNLEGKKCLQCRLLVMLIVMLIVIIISSITYIATHDASHTAMNIMNFLFVIALVFTFFIYLVAAMVSANIARVISSYQISDLKCSPVKAFVLTYVGFASALYLQYNINRIPKVKV
jgi:hypothetical protein